MIAQGSAQGAEQRTKVLEPRSLDLIYRIFVKIHRHYPRKQIK